MSFRDIELKHEYRSSLDDIIRDFYNPVLKQAVNYKRAAGFFSSSALLPLASGICSLIENDGIMQIIASPRLSKEDIEAVNYGLLKRDEANKEVLLEALLHELKKPKDKFEKSRLNLLSKLIAARKLEIKIAVLEDNSSVGMFHEKLGLMYDREGNIAAFSGSMNESAIAFTTNYEAIDVFTSWTQDAERVYAKQAAFNAMWENCEPGIRIIDFPEVNDEILRHRKLNRKIAAQAEQKSPANVHLRQYQNDEILRNHKINSKIVAQAEPGIQTNVHLRQYQIEAVEEWAKRNYSGIFDMATGTGKTYTALAAAAKLFSDLNHNLAVIIICPYQHLVEQWKEDITAFGMKPIVCYSASPQKNWRERLRTAVTSFNLRVLNHFCMVSTNATFSTDYVQDLMRKLKGNVVLIVDEAHNFGAENLSKTLLSNIPFRLALSATIDRYGDPEGTQKLYNYFGEKCIEYTIKDAIDNGMLTPYYYHPVPVSLNQEELNDYIELTAKIRKNIHTDKDGRIKFSEYAKILLIKRARIVAGASEKITALRSLMKDFKNDNKILVYCGTGAVNDSDCQEERARQIDLVAGMLGNDLGMRVSKFTSEESAEERERIKANFADGKHLQVLVAVRCLDEGVNIPSIKTAFILAGSTNPKEYIQRRGRVLRKFPGKNYAVIYDFVTLPVPLGKLNEYDNDIVESVKSLAKREISRIKDFAAIAENPFDSDALITEIQRNYHIEGYNLSEAEEDV